MDDGSFNLLGAASANVDGDSSSTSGSDLLSKFGAVDISGSDDGASGGSNGGGNRSGSGDDFDPAIHVGRDKRNADGSYTRKRGRRANTSSGTSERKARGSAGVKAIQNSLEGIHAIIAAATGFEDIRLSADESEPLAGAIAEVSKHYNIPVVDPKYMAIAGLIFVAGKVYGPKAMLVKMELQERKEKRLANKESNVVTLFPDMPPFTKAREPVEPASIMTPSVSAEIPMNDTQF